jgi:hypothetical protein
MSIAEPNVIELNVARGSFDLEANYSLHGGRYPTTNSGLNEAAFEKVVKNCIRDIVGDLCRELPELSDQTINNVMKSAKESIDLSETPLKEIYATVRTIVGTRPSMQEFHQRASFIISMVLMISSDDLYSDSDIFVQVKKISHESRSNASLHQPIERSRVNSELCGQSPNNLLCGQQFG